VKMMLACQSHIGAVNLDPCMAPYVFKTRADGVNIINLQATWEKLVLAARIIAGIENPKDIVVIAASLWSARYPQACQVPRRSGNCWSFHPWYFHQPDSEAFL